MRPVLLFLLILAVIAEPAAAAPGAQAKPASQPAAVTAEDEFLLARRLERESKIEEAIAALKRAIVLAPQSAEIRAELAALYAREDRAADAVSTAEEALAIDPANVEANRILGSILAALSDQKRPLRPGDDPATYAGRAVAALEKGRGIAGSDLNVELTLGRLHLRAERYEQAIASLRHIFEQQPQYSEGGMLLSAAQEGAGRIDDAIETLKATVELNPNFFRGHARLIALYERQHRWKEAAEAYEAAQQLKPGPELLRGRAIALMNAGHTEEARQMLQKATGGGGPADPALLSLLAETQRKLKDYAAALGTIEQLRQAYPDQQVFVYQHAQVLEETGRVDEAERELRALLAKDPADANALNSLGYMFAERGERLDEAVELIRRALTVEPGNASFLDSLGWAYFKQGRFELADPPLTEAAGKMPGNSVIQDHLGDLRFRQQRFDEAVAAWERALKGDGESIDRAVIEKKLRDARARVKK